MLTGTRAQPQCYSLAEWEVSMPNPRSTASISSHPIHPTSIPFPIAFFVATSFAMSCSGEPEAHSGHQPPRRCE